VNECVAEFNEKYFYLDGFHLSSDGAEIIVNEIEKLLIFQDK
jgi:lysophospholipase L1-like esterase